MVVACEERKEEQREYYRKTKHKRESPEYKEKQRERGIKHRQSPTNLSLPENGKRARVKRGSGRCWERVRAIGRETEWTRDAE